MPITIDKPSKYFNTILYTGTGASNTRTGLEFKPDFVLIKSRSAGWDTEAEDSVRGATKILSPKTTNAEETDAQGITSFNSNGFTLGTRGGINASGDTYVAWNWLASNTTVTNTSGSITSTVSANTTSGFSIVSYTGNSSASQSVGHGLGVAPKMIIVKNRDVGTRNWKVYHSGLGSPSLELTLNSTSAQGTDTQQWANTVPTSTLFYVGASGESNNSGSKHIAYCFAEVKGFSKFGKYTGNGSNDGTFVYTGFKPAFTLIKPIEISDWVLQDSVRETFNDGNRNALFPNTSDAEAVDANPLDYLSNGFKPRNAGTGVNQSGYTYIYMSFASNPFVSSKGIPTTAR